ncbi:MAG: AhpC/TSA family protein [Solirubrobacteraceae bacterium]
MFCKQHAIQLDRAREQFEAAGAGLVLIGLATPRQAAHFRNRQGLHLRVLADENRESYEAAGAKRANATGLVGPRVVAKGALATLRTGRLQTRPVGDSAQLGGALVIVPDGNVAWSHMSQDASDNAQPREILAALRAHSPQAARSGN